MSDIQITLSQATGFGFIPEEFLPPKADEFYLRNQQCPRRPDEWRPLHPTEIDALTANNNTASDWKNIHVVDPFDPAQIKDNQFYGLVRIGKVRPARLSHHDMELPIGITNSCIISCDIGDDAAIHNVRYLAHYIIGDNVILFNLDEIHTTNHAKFGNGIVKDGEDEDVRILLDIGNEAGGRAVIPFDGMTAGDAYLWSRYRGDTELMQRLREITQNQFDTRRGWYGTVGRGCVIKHCRTIKDVKFGEFAYVKGANKLKNLTIDSTEDEPTQIGEGVEMVNGIISAGCHAFYGCKAVRFVMAPCSNLKYGARLIHSYLGDNSTVSCCENLNNLIFPAHEQHHNDSFLIASTLCGQSNIAAGATLGSNHNSRANEGEIFAGRGFWPGLCSSLKHSCRFASFTLLAKGSYPAELNIPLPFSLLSDDVTNNRLLIMPAYWWLYNMYALMRNSWKFRARDNRKAPVQHVEFDFLAPDTAEEMLAAMRLLEIWTARASCRQAKKQPEITDETELRKLGASLLAGPDKAIAKLEILGEDMENSRRPVVILKAGAAWRAYREMLFYYAAKNLLDWRDAHPGVDLDEMNRSLAAARQSEWVNLGGQLIPAPDVTQLRKDIKSGELNDWPAIHAACDRLWAEYPTARQQHAYATLLAVLGETSITPERWNELIETAIAAQNTIAERTYQSRKKDYENPFRKTTFADEAEMTAVVGTAEDNKFVLQVRRETADFEKRAKAAMAN
jgi:hypothetical protein